MFKKFKVKSFKAFPYITAFMIGYTLTAFPGNAYAADGTQKIVNSLNNLSNKLMTIGTPAAGLGFTGAAVVHSFAHDPKYQEASKLGMKAAGAGIAGTLLGGAIVGTIASAIG